MLRKLQDIVDLLQMMGFFVIDVKCLAIDDAGRRRAFKIIAVQGRIVKEIIVFANGNEFYSPDLP